jgi:hypothetical protein
MSTLIPNTFSTYQLSAEETTAGFAFTQSSLEVLHNQRAMIAEQKLALTYDPSNAQHFLQQEAYLRGQIELISWMFEMAETTSRAQFEAAQTSTTVITTNESPSSLIFGRT